MATLLDRTEAATELRVRDIMHPRVIRILPDATVRQLISLLAYYGVGNVPVVERSGRVIGVVSAADVLHLAAEESRVPIWYVPREQAMAGEPMAQPRSPTEPTAPEQYQALYRPLLEDLSDHVLVACTVREVMMPVTVSVPPTATIPELAHCLLRTGVDRALVVDQEKLLGVVTSADLLRAVARAGHTRGWEADEPFKVVAPS